MRQMHLSPGINGSKKARILEEELVVDDIEDPRLLDKPRRHLRLLSLSLSLRSGGLKEYFLFIYISLDM